jgi:hypothetical protein
MKISEYDVSFAIKEFLISKDYIILTWNPPGSQGTFTIPNPKKDPNYKGQEGSESPDIIAYKNRELLVVEVKDSINKIAYDVSKVKNLLNDNERKKLLFKIIKKQAEANKINIDIDNSIVKLGIGIPKSEGEIEKKIAKNQYQISFFIVELLKKDWDNKIIDANTNFLNIFKVKVIQ